MLWAPTANDIIVSSASSSVTTPTIKGISPQDTILQFKIPNSTTSISHSNRILYDWGMYIMAPSTITCSSSNPSITYNNAVSQPNAATVTCQTQTSGTNSYTLIKIKSTNNTGPNQINNNLFGISGITIKGDSWDFYISAIDSIDGPTYNQTINSYYLVHAPLKPDDSSGLTLSYLNYYSTSSGGLDGSTAPTMLRISGTVS